MTSPVDRYVVMGNPIDHSKSPRIHALFAAQTGQQISYDALLVEKDGFASALRIFEEQGGKGANVTVPFKQEAWRQVDELSPRAQRAGAVNTIVFHGDGVRYGDNTDGIGLVADLQRNHNIQLTGKQILLLGAGGAVRGVLGPLLAEKPQRIVIANRTVDKAEQLALGFSDLGSVEGCGFPALEGKEFDLIINGTAASLHGEVPPLPPSVVALGCCCYDMMYGNKPTAFMDWARRREAANVCDGLGMLVEQAAEAFFLWRGVRPETLPVTEALRASG